MKKRIIIGIALIIVVLLGTSYAWFNYRGDSSNQKLVSGDIYLTLNSGSDSININNIYPISKEEARARDDNFLTFTISGKNTSSKNVYYEIFLTYGAAKEYPYERFNDNDLVFDLVELDENDNETYLLEAVSYDTLNNRKIWVDTVVHDTNNQVNRRFKLRMWLSDKVTIGNGNDVTYNQDNFKNHYASIKFGVSGDLNEKSLPSSTTTRDSYVENGKSYFLTNLSNDYLLEDEGKLLDNNDTVILEITNPENKLYFNYIDSKGNEDDTNNESLRLTYTYNKNETVNIKVFTTSRNDSNISTTLHFKVIKNGSVVQEYNKQIDVIGNNYCLNNGFTKLSDCILVTENLSKNVNNAKTFINSKGSPNVSVTAPTYNYVEKVVDNQVYTGAADVLTWSSGAGYEFNSSTGTFALKQEDGVTAASEYVPLSDDLIDKYTCGVRNSGYRTCGSIYKVTSVDVANNQITGTRITYNLVNSFDSQQGLYRVLDNDGDSYIYRGNITNNNVYFGGYYWKILRINGDGSIRLIFNGNTLSSNGNQTAGHNAAISTTSDTGANGTYAFNLSPGGPTYVGYMTTEADNYWKLTTTTSYEGFSEDVQYYFANGFDPYTDEFGNRMFKLKQSSAFKSKLKDLTETQLSSTLYTCSGIDENLICNRLVEIESRTSNTSVNGYYITYSPNYEADTSITKLGVEQNERDSNAKKQLDLWYQNKFMNNLNNGNAVTDYIVDSAFCNDRNITDASGSNNSGYLLTSHTYYAGMTRLRSASDAEKNATLMCSKNDNFSVTETSTKNGKLTYPVGLISFDEVALAGGKYNERNTRNYLKTGGSYWTMTPDIYSRTSARAFEAAVGTSGALAYTSVDTEYGLRAVINLSSNTLISTGDGTIGNPYQLSLN